MKIALVYFSASEMPIDWSNGPIYYCKYSPNHIAQCVGTHIDDTETDAWCFWDEAFNVPDVEKLMDLLNTNGDVFHAGLLIGTSNKPDWLKFVSPTSMLNCDPPTNIEATSWRLSLRCCLIRTNVLKHFGGPFPKFISADSAGLELGFRFIRDGVFIRHVPDLLTVDFSPKEVSVPVIDQIFFLRLHYTRQWVIWAFLRAILTRSESITNIISSFFRTREITYHFNQPIPYLHKKNSIDPAICNDKVSVIIPTLNRYPYLVVLLNQLRKQTFKAHEIIVVDQTPLPMRDYSLLDEYKDLPVRWFFIDIQGQCSSRNFGLQNVTGDYILFLDDDVEVPETLIQLHLTQLKSLDINVSNGIAYEVGMPEIPKNFLYQRISDVFPAGNSMISRSILKKSGLFDLAFDRGQVEDADIGMRIYLNGEMMVLSPEICVLHHHAQQGGLREYNSRKTTSYMARQKIKDTIVPSMFTIYLARRYFPIEYVRELLWIAVLVTFKANGKFSVKIAKFLYSCICLPRTIVMILTAYKRADNMLNNYPKIPSIDVS